RPRDVLGLVTLGSLTDFKLDGLAFGQRLVAVHLNGREVHEDILARLALDEPVALRSVEPLHHTLFSRQLLTPVAKMCHLLPVTPVGCTRKAAQAAFRTPTELQERQTQDYAGTKPKRCLGFPLASGPWGKGPRRLVEAAHRRIL